MPVIGEHEPMFPAVPTEIKVRGDGLTPMERFWKNGNYRKSDDLRRRCQICKNATGNNKCNKIGVTDSPASDINPGFVCNYFKSVFDEG